MVCDVFLMNINCIQKIKGAHWKEDGLNPICPLSAKEPASSLIVAVLLVIVANPAYYTHTIATLFASIRRGRLNSRVKKDFSESKPPGYGGVSTTTKKF